MKLICIACVLLITGCFILDNRHVYIIPDKLPSAVVGMPYHEEIMITGSPVNWVEIDGVENYQENDLAIKIGITNPTQQIVEINGIPKNLGTFKFSIRGSTSGTQCSGLRFEKTFTITTYEKDKITDIKTCSLKSKNNHNLSLTVYN